MQYKANVSLVNSQSKSYSSSARELDNSVSTFTYRCTDDLDVTLPPLYMKSFLLHVWNISMINACLNLTATVGMQLLCNIFGFLHFL